MYLWLTQAFPTKGAAAKFLVNMDQVLHVAESIADSNRGGSCVTMNSKPLRYYEVTETCEEIGLDLQAKNPFYRPVRGGPN